MTKVILDMPARNIVRMRDMKRGQHGIVQDESYRGAYVICVYEPGETLNGLVVGFKQNGKADTWTHTRCNYLQVEILPPGTEITLVVE